MEDVSSWILALFIITTAISIVFFWFATNKNTKIAYLVLAWALFQAILGISGFYQNFEASPPRFIFLLAPGFLVTAMLFLSGRGKKFIDSLNIQWLTVLHTVRVPVEIVLYYIFLIGLIPVEMTFEGRNFDIIAGLSAPLIYFFAFKNSQVKRWLLFAWNVASLLLLINILTIAVLSAKTPFQQMALEQPNIGVTYFPFVWLPSVIVPIVLISQLAGIRKAVLNKL